jgi:transcription elongation GreA/GreB family factor
MAKKYMFTRAGLKRVQEELTGRITELEETNRRMGASASIDNDLRENPEFMQLRIKAEYELPRKISDLRSVLSDYVLIEPTMPPAGTPLDEVLPGADVELRGEEGQVLRYRVLGYGDSDPEAMAVSYLAPVGQELLGKTVGDEANVRLNGKVARLEIVSIRAAAI